MDYYEDEDPAAKAPRDIAVEAAQANVYYWATLVSTIVLFLSGLIAVIVVLASDDEIDLDLKATTDYRVGTQSNDDFPTSPMLEAVSSGSGTDVPLLAAFISVGAFFGYLLLTLWWRRVIEEMSRSGSGFLWFVAHFWHALIWLVIYFYAGATNIFLMGFLVIAVFTWLGFWWDGQLLMAPAYLRVGMSLPAENRRAMGFTWLPLFRGWATLIYVYVVASIYLAQNYGDSPDSPDNEFLIPPIVGMVMYAVYPIIELLAYFRLWFVSVYVRDLTYVIYGAVLAIVMTWLPILIATSDP